MAMNGYKVTLNQGTPEQKVVQMRKMEISDYAKACEASGMKYSTEAGQRAAISEELVKMLLHSVNGKPLTGIERESLSDIFSMQEFMNLIEVVNTTSGIHEKKVKPTVEVVSIGEKSPGSPATPA